MKGRKPKPENLHILHGTDQKCRMEKRNEPKLDKKLPTCPRHLGTVARKEFKRIVAEYKNVNVLHALDMVGLVAYCELWEALVRASESVRLIDKELDDLKRDRLAELEDKLDFMKLRSRLMTEYRSTVNTMKPLLAAYGFTPLDRPRINAPVGEDHSAREMEEFLFGDK
jgi:P27 family predicted phage terminase small subunit